MFRNLLILMMLMNCLSPLFSAVQLDIQVDAESAILMNAQTGQVLFEKEAHKPQHPASITKIASMAYALERKGEGYFNEQVVADQDSIGAISAEQKKRSNYTKPPYWMEFGGTHMGIKTGEVLSLKDLYYGALLISANDAVNLIAKDVSGDIPKFTQDLNSYVQSLGAHETHFENPHGLHHPKQLTTAYDMACIASHAAANPLFGTIASALEYRRPKTNKQESTLMSNTASRLLSPKRKGYYEYLLWIKTGFHLNAKHNIVAVAEKEGRRLVAVLMRAPSKEGKYSDVVKMFEKAFAENKEHKVIISAGSAIFSRPVEGGTSSKLQALSTQDLSIEYFPSEPPTIQTYLRWKALTLPIAQGAEVGFLQVQMQPSGKEYAVPLYAQHAIAKSSWVKFRELYRDWLWVPGALSLLLGIIFIFSGKEQTVQRNKVI